MNETFWEQLKKRKNAKRPCKKRYLMERKWQTVEQFDKTKCQNELKK